jgi:hypothetical protein
MRRRRRPAGRGGWWRPGRGRPWRTTEEQRELGILGGGYGEARAYLEEQRKSVGDKGRATDYLDGCPCRRVEFFTAALPCLGPEESPPRVRRLPLPPSTVPNGTTHRPFRFVCRCCAQKLEWPLQPLDHRDGKYPGMNIP